MQIKVFGQLTEVLGAHELQREIVSDTDLLKRNLISEFPDLAGYSFAIAIDKKIVVSNQTIREGAVIALLPPFSGG